MTIINGRADLRRYVDNVLSNWTFDATVQEMADKLTSNIWWMITPDVGEDWSEYLNKLDWDQLIIEADAEIDQARRAQ